MSAKIAEFGQVLGKKLAEPQSGSMYFSELTGYRDASNERICRLLPAYLKIGPTSVHCPDVASINWFLSQTSRTVLRIMVVQWTEGERRSGPGSCVVGYCCVNRHLIRVCRCRFIGAKFRPKTLRLSSEAGFAGKSASRLGALPNVLFTTTFLPRP